MRIFNPGRNNSSSITYNDTTANIVDGTTAASLQSAITTLDSRLDTVESERFSRQKLTNDTTYYVDALNGDDANTGEQTAPFATCQKALDLVDRNLDLSGYQLIIQIAEGDYTSEGLLHLPVITGAKAETCGPPPIVLPPNSQIRIVGSGEGTRAAAFELDHHAYYSIENLKLGSVAHNSITAQRSGSLELKDIYFVGHPDYYSALVATDNGIIFLNGDFYFYGTWLSLFKADSNGQIKINPGVFCSIHLSQLLINIYLITSAGNSFVDLESAFFNFDFDA